jgi:protein involved in polysaccharide export with SLBB domain
MIRVMPHLVCLFLLLILPGRSIGAEYLLGPDDKLSLKVYEWPDLGGDFKISADGRISVPLIGSVTAAGLTVDQLEKTIQAMLAQEAGLKESPSVAVEIKDYRPFYITGDVQKPGAYPFHPGLTILQAVSVAGGFFRFTDPGLVRLERDAIVQRGERRMLTENLADLIARNARLKAEREGATDVSFPDDRALNQRDPRVAAVMARERLIFRTRRDDLNKQLASLNDLQNLYQGEIEALQSQIESEKQQGQLIQKEVDELRALAARGLTSNPRLFLVERTQAEIEGTQRNIQAIIMRSRQSIAQAAQQGEDLKAKFRERVDTESDEVSAKMQETRARLDTASQLVTEAEQTAPTTVLRRLRNVGMEPKFTLSRRTSSGATQEIEADSSHEIEPGDVVLVSTSSEGTIEVKSKQSAIQSDRTQVSEAH